MRRQTVPREVARNFRIVSPPRQTTGRLMIGGYEFVIAFAPQGFDDDTPANAVQIPGDDAAGQFRLTAI